MVNLSQLLELTLLISKGGPGSGNWGHAGRKGKKGGSGKGGGLKTIGVKPGSSREERIKAGKLTSLTRGVTADNIETFLIRRRQSLEKDSPLKQALRKKLKGQSEDTIIMYTDVMSMDEKNFDKYAQKLDLENAAGLKKATLSRQKMIDQEVAQLRYHLRRKNTLEVDTPLDDQFFSQLDKRTDTRSRQKLENDLRRLKVRVLADEGTDSNRVQADLSRLALLAEESPAVRETMVTHVDRVRFHEKPRYEGHTAVADYDPSRRTINIYPTNYPGVNHTPSFVFAHEVGHAAEEFGQSRDIGQIFDRGKRTSMYGWGNPGENFAETFASIVAGNQERLSQNMTEQYDYIINNVPGFEQTVFKADIWQLVAARITEKRMV